MLKIKSGSNSHKSHTVEDAIKDVTKELEKPLNIMIPENLHTKFKIKTTANKTNMKNVLIEMIDKYTSS